MAPFWICEHTDDNADKEISTILVMFTQKLSIWQSNIYIIDDKIFFSTFHKAIFYLIFSQTGLNSWLNPAFGAQLLILVLFCFLLESPPFPDFPNYDVLTMNQQQNNRYYTRISSTILQWIF